VKRLLLLAVACTGIATATVPAHATVITCDNLPVMVNCFHWGPNGVEHCDVWVRPSCIELDDILHNVQ
jgi:hypothetical protein